MKLAVWIHFKLKYFLNYIYIYIYLSITVADHNIGSHGVTICQSISVEFVVYYIIQANFSFSLIILEDYLLMVNLKSYLNSHLKKKKVS